MSISIAGLDKGEVLAALYNASRPLGLGFLQYDPKPMTKEEANQFLQQTLNFDYLIGRVMKISLDKDDLYTDLYNHDNGYNAAEKVIEALRNNQGSNSDIIQEAHTSGLIESANSLMPELDRPSTETKENGVSVVTLGFNDMKHILEPKINEALNTVIDTPNKVSR